MEGQHDPLGLEVDDMDLGQHDEADAMEEVVEDMADIEHEGMLHSPEQESGLFGRLLPFLLLAALVYFVYQKYKSQATRPRLQAQASSAPAAESAEEVRRKRLERLAGSASAPAAAGPAMPDASAAASATLSASEERKLKAKEAMDEYIKQQEAARRVKEEKQTRAREAAQERQREMMANAAKNMMSSSSSQGTKRTPERNAESDDADDEKTKRRKEEDRKEQEAEEGLTDEQKLARRAHRTISRILNAGFTHTEQSLKSSRSSKNPVHKFLLPRLAAELQSEGQELLLSTYHIDSALSEVLEQVPTPDQALRCLFDAYNRARDALRLPNALLDVIEDTSRCIVTHTGLMLQGTPLWRMARPSSEPLALLLLPYLEAAPTDDLELPNGLLQQLAQQFEDEGLTLILDPILNYLRQSVGRKSLLEPFLQHLRALALLTKAGPIAKAITRLPNWEPLVVGANGRDMELRSYLGPFFHFTSFPENPAVGDFYFRNSLQRTYEDINGSFHVIRSQLNPLQGLLHEVMMNLLKSGDRETVLNWLAHVLTANRGRTKMQVDRFSVSSEGFMLNLASVLLRACQPFTDGIKNEKIKRIDSSYFLFTRRIDTSQETRLSSSSEQVRTWVQERLHAFKTQQKGSSSEPSETELPPLVDDNAEDRKGKGKEPSDSTKDPTTFYFVTEAFFLTHYCLHVGLVRTCSMHTQYVQSLGRLHKKIKDMESTMPQWQQSPQAAMMRANLDRMKKQLEVMHRGKLAMDAHLLDPMLLQAALNFYAFSAKWLCHLVDPEARGLPLAPPEMEFCALPEYLVDDMIAFVLFVLRFNPDAVSTSLAATSLVDFLVLFLGSSQHIKNPYLRSQLVEVLYEFSPDSARDEFRGERRVQLPFVFQQIDTNPTAIKHLTPALIKLYVDIETTGRHGQFYDKFFVRRHIALLLKYMRALPQYEGAMKAASRNSSLFLQFVNMLINDATYLLDEVLLKLGEIHNIELEMQNREQWEAQPEETRAEREQTLAQNEGYTSTFGILSNETILLLLYDLSSYYLSEKAPETFLRPEMVDRIAVMLNYYVIELASQKCQEIQVWDPAKYNFTPKEWFKKIIEIYLNFAQYDDFKEAVQRDGRSFKPEGFRRIIGMLKEQMILSLPDIERFRVFVEEAAAYHAQEQQAEAELGEVPDEFLDPITCELMEDPVILPTSNHTMDRAAITRHLLSDPTDPFNRARLTIEMLQPDTALKARIEEWKRSKRENRTSG